MAKLSLVFCVVLCLLNLVIEVTNGLAVPRSSGRTCIIGAGISGLATAKYLQDYGVTNFTVFEATRHIGGTWRFDPHVGVDEDGLPLYTSQYKYLRTNTPRETMEFEEFPFPEGTPSYPSGTCYYKYLKLFTKNYDLYKYIQFRSHVRSVRWNKDRWSLSYHNTETQSDEVASCDYVVLCSGHYSKPRWPKFEGAEAFKGSMIHSHDYKEPEPYRNRRVLLLGAGPSGLDLATHLVNVTQKLVHSHHLVYNQPNFPKNYVKKPDIRAFTTDGVIFVDGSFEQVDDVIFCTGFDFDYPFLDETSGVTVSGKFVLPVYQDIVNIRRPSMMFIGLTQVTITRVLLSQGEYAAAAIAGKFKLPPQEQMLKHWLSKVYYLDSIGKKIVNVNLIGNLQDQYFGNLTSEAGVKRAPPVLTEIRDFNAQIRLDDLLHYRDYDFNITDAFHYDRYYHPVDPNNVPCPIDIDF
ncbi:unnamed protein product [Plutella xylostella]|uniref:Flavin-containing monooxygenase n=2 Tax=Plutella xylostella TaxID=51655 RepID=A0A8S4G3K7_PLUXY|nr:unnamed protein product [Plutella xylostella]